MTALEGALAFAIVGSLLVIGTLTFKKHWRSSRLVEPVSGLEHIAAHAVLLAEAGHPVVSAPLTPSEVPRAPVIDLEGAWDHPTWKALEFRASPEGVPHSFSFVFDATADGFVAHSYGDLDGDGVRSSFELSAKKGADGHLTITPGMRVENELE